MSSIPQNHCDEKALVYCIQNFFPTIMSESFSPNVMG